MTAARRKRDPDARELIDVSREVGADPSLVQEGGGNTSVKSRDGETMFVKASGTSLARMSFRRGFRQVRLADVLDLVTDADLARRPSAERESETLRRLVDAAVDDRPGRPSVETSLHAFLGRFVLHYHPALSNGICCARNAADLVAEEFGDRAAFVRYTDPGIPLARATYRAVRRRERERGAPPPLIFLENHGIFVSAETGAKALRVARSIERGARRRRRELRGTERGPHAVPRNGASESLRRRVASAARRVWAEALEAPKAFVRFADGPNARQALARPDVARLMRIGPLTPDHVVYAHGQPVWLDSTEGDLETALAEALDRARRKLPKTPRTLLVSGVGLFAADADARGARAALTIGDASLATLLMADALGGCRGLTPRAVEYLEAWEVESFRRNVMKGK